MFFQFSQIAHLHKTEQKSIYFFGIGHRFEIFSLSSLVNFGIFKFKIIFGVHEKYLRIKKSKWVFSLNEVKILSFLLLNLDSQEN